jgi:hypothetical protein
MSAPKVGTNCGLDLPRAIAKSTPAILRHDTLEAGVASRAVSNRSLRINFLESVHSILGNPFPPQLPKDVPFAR